MVGPVADESSPRQHEPEREDRRLLLRPDAPGQPDGRLGRAAGTRQPGNLRAGQVHVHPGSNFKLAYCLKSNVSVSIGYSLMYWDSVALAGNRSTVTSISAPSPTGSAPAPSSTSTIRACGSRDSIWAWSSTSRSPDLRGFDDSVGPEHPVEADVRVKLKA